MYKCLFGIVILIQTFFLSPCSAEGESTYLDCQTVEANFKYDGSEKYCELMARCTKCLSGFRLACDTAATIPVYCKAHGSRCPSAQACLDDNSFDVSVIKRLTDSPKANPCGNGNVQDSGAAR